MSTLPTILKTTTQHNTIYQSGRQQLLYPFAVIICDGFVLLIEVRIFLVLHHCEMEDLY